MSTEISTFSFYASEPRSKVTWKFNLQKKLLCGAPTSSDFEFLEGSNRSHVGDSDLDDAAFIRQELFQLKLPPQYLNNTDEVFNQRSSTPAKYPPRREARRSFQRQRLWNDCFDPFLVASENVKEDHDGKIHRFSHKRVWSMLSLSGLIDSVEWEFKPIMASLTPMKKEARPVSAPRFEVPRGVLYARKLRQLEIGSKLGQKVH